MTIQHGLRLMDLGGRGKNHGLSISEPVKSIGPGNLSSHRSFHCVNKPVISADFFTRWNETGDDRSKSIRELYDNSVESG